MSFRFRKAIVSIVLLCAIPFLTPVPASGVEPEVETRFPFQVLTATEPRDRDWFGWAFAISGNSAVVSSVADETSEVYVFDLEGDTWVKSATIDPGLDNFKPDELAVDGDILVMGRSSYDDPDICTPEQPNCNSGIALLYERNRAGSGEWVFQKALGGNRVPSAGFGSKLQVDGETIVVSAYGEDVDDSPAVSGSSPQVTPEAIENAGAVYIYERNAGGPGEWGLVQRIEQETSIVDSFFGSDPLLAGNTLILNEGSSGGYKTGDVVYERQAGEEGAWVMTQRIPLLSYRIESTDFDGVTLVQSYFDEVSLVNSYQFFERDETGQFVLVQEFEKLREGLIGWGSLAIDHGQMVELAGDGELVGRTFEKHLETGLWEETGELRHEGLSAPDPDRVREAALDGGRLLIGTWRGEYRGEVLAYEIAPPINAGHMGGWYNPNTPGQGVLVDVDEASAFMFGAWFTYTLETSAGPHEHHWFTAQGNYAGNKAGLMLYETLGGQFDAPTPVETLPVGEATISFSDCANGVVSYRIDTLGVRGEFPVVRLIPGSQGTCENRNVSQVQSVDINPGMNGGWFNEQTSGQGFLVDAHPNGTGGGFIFVAWFTYGDSAASGQRWLTAQGNFDGSTAEMVVYETTGGSFDDPLGTDTQTAGTMSIDFTECSSANMSYQLDEGLSGDVSLIRLIPGAEALCKELEGED